MAICIINRPDPGEKLGNNQGIQSILDLHFQHVSRVDVFLLVQRSMLKGYGRYVPYCNTTFALKSVFSRGTSVIVIGSEVWITAGNSPISTLFCPSWMSSFCGLIV